MLRLQSITPLLHIQPDGKKQAHTEDLVGVVYEVTGEIHVELEDISFGAETVPVPCVNEGMLDILCHARVCVTGSCCVCAFWSRENEIGTL